MFKHYHEWILTVLIININACYNYLLGGTMQRSEGSSESASTVALRTSTSAQAPVVQPVPASQQVSRLSSDAQN